MKVALIDNGSLEPAAHRNLRGLAAALSVRAGVHVHAVSLKHSDRIRPDLLDDAPALTLRTWLADELSQGEREFVFVPFFISAQGAIGSMLRRQLDGLRAELGDFQTEFSPGLAECGALTRIVTDRIRETLSRHGLWRPSVIVVDHGGPSAESARIRNEVTAGVTAALGNAIGHVAAASLEGAEYAHARPMFADILATEHFDRGHIVVAPLFLAPGRHAGPRGDLAEIAIAAEDRLTVAPLHCHFTELVGTHAFVAPALADGLVQTLTQIHAY